MVGCLPDAPAPGIRLLTVRDGRTVEMRRLEAFDRTGLEQAIRRLSPETRYRRFASPKPYVSQRELDYLLDLDHHRREALLAIEPDSRRGVAVVRYVEVPGESAVVEVAATVDDGWQGQGLGGAMLDAIIVRAREEGYAAVRATVLAGNARAIGILLSAGFRPHSSDGTLREYELMLARPNRG